MEYSRIRWTTRIFISRWREVWRMGTTGSMWARLSSPSSSVVWPFLLTPFVGWAWGEYVPLGLNVLFCGMAAWGIGRFVDGLRVGMSWGARLGVACALMLAGNLAGLTFVGMEHGLQVMLAIGCAAGVAEAYRGRGIPAWCVWAAAVGPMVRYENFALVVAVGIALWGQGRLRAAVQMAGASLVGPVLFSLFLVSRGLPALPTSVLVKARMYAAAGSAAATVMGTPFVAGVGVVGAGGAGGDAGLADGTGEGSRAAVGAGGCGGGGGDATWRWDGSTGFTGMRCMRWCLRRRRRRWRWWSECGFRCGA